MKPEPYFFADFQKVHDLLRRHLEKKARYLLLTGESGSGKTTLVRSVAKSLDRCRFRLQYFNTAKLNPGGFARVLARSLRVPIARSQPETLRTLTHTLLEDPTHLLVVIDEAQRLPDDTLAELYTFAEADLDGSLPITLLFSALPPLRDRLQAPHLFPLWRRFQARLEIAGLGRDEILPFCKHHCGQKPMKRFEPEALHTLAERSRALPGLLISYLDHLLDEAPAETPISADLIESILQRWDLV